jgi:isopentenyl diphosphate isomerase/L-lactate dehydrogenase-like FMN-dependent dehydrogenase
MSADDRAASTAGSLLTLGDYERAAATVLDPAALGYVAGGAADELSVHDNLLAWRRLAIRPRVRDRETRTEATVQSSPAELVRDESAPASTPADLAGNVDPDLRWSDIEALATEFPLPVIVKGILTPVDGGIRRGTDVLKALALGARAVLVGQPVLWGLAVGGATGAQRVLEILLDEFDRALALTGCPRAAELTRSFVAAAPWLAPRS